MRHLIVSGWLGWVCYLCLQPALGDDSWRLPNSWTYGPPLIAPESRSEERSYAQKDPSLVFAGGRWHVFMTVKLPQRSAIEYCSFEHWHSAASASRSLLAVSESDYFCAPQVFYFEPHQLWYLVYQVGVPNPPAGHRQMMWVAYSTTPDISKPDSWTPARPMLDGGPDDPRIEGGLDYWIICDERKAYLFYTSLNGKLWRLSTDLGAFPSGFADCALALEGDFFEASHTYQIEGRQQYLTLLEQDGQRYFQAYVADQLDGEWSPLAVSRNQPFAGAVNIKPRPGVERWTDNVSHGELIRQGINQRLTVSPDNLRFVFQGLLDSEKQDLGYGQLPWRIGILEADPIVTSENH